MCLLPFKQKINGDREKEDNKKLVNLKHTKTNKKFLNIFLYVS